MKYFKSFMLLAAMSLFVACSSDDESYNSNEGVTAGFATDSLIMKENSGIFNIPIVIEGQRNGEINLTVQVLPTDGSNQAVEDQHFLITTKNLRLPQDTTATSILNVQIKTVDDQEINENREFKLKITSLNGAKLQKDEIVVVLRDNDAAFYEKFFGKWTIKFTDYDGVEQSKTVNISGPTDEEDPDYDKTLTASCPGMFNVGVSLDCQWHFRYSFDTATKKGTLAFILGEVIATYSTAYEWRWASDDGTNYTFDDIATEWELGEKDAFPTTITWNPNQYMYLLMTNGFWDLIREVSMTKVQ